jgi:hypothetical protein
LIYYGRDNDPFQQVKEWWNSKGLTYNAPSAHLFELLGIRNAAAGHAYECGKGKLLLVRQDPKELVLKPQQDSSFLQLVKQAYEQEAQAGPLETKNFFYLERGPYNIASVMDESVSPEPLRIKGPLIDLFDPELPVLSEKIVRPGEQAYLYDPARVKNKQQPKVLCAASRVYKEQTTPHTYTFLTRSPSNTQNVMRILLPAKPARIVITAPNSQPQELALNWDEPTHTTLLKFENASEGVKVAITF